MKTILIVWTCLFAGYLLGFFHAALCAISKKADQKLQSDEKNLE